MKLSEQLKQRGITSGPVYASSLLKAREVKEQLRAARSRPV